MKTEKSISPPSTTYTDRNKFNYGSKPMLPIKNLQNIKILSLSISPQGKSGGVLFIESTQGSFVVKPCNSSPSDFFCNELALTLDVNVPVMTIVSCYDNQFKKLVFQIEKYALPDQTLSARLNNKLNFPFYQVMEYIPSISLVSMGKQKFKQFINSQENIYRLYSLGMVLGFDFVINNSDRFQCIWRGTGNINNILIQIDCIHPKIGRNWVDRSRDRDDLTVPFDNFVFIDHDSSMPDTHQQMAIPNIQKYMEKVTNFQLHIVMFLRGQYSSLPPQFDKLVTQIKLITQLELTQEQCSSICEGIIYVTMKFIMVYDKNQIHQLHQSMIRDVKQFKNRNDKGYWDDYWNRQYKRVHLNFCQLYYIKISAIYTTYPELINKIFEKVDGVMQKWKNSRSQRRRVSLLKNKEGQVGEKEKQYSDSDREYGEDQGGDRDREGEEEGVDKKKKRRWRQKLNVFKQQNYKDQRN